MIDEKLPIMKEQKATPTSIQINEKIISVLVKAGISPQPTVVMVYVAQYSAQMYQSPEVLSLRFKRAIQVSSLKLQNFAVRNQKHAKTWVSKSAVIIPCIIRVIAELSLTCLKIFQMVRFFFALLIILNNRINLVMRQSLGNLASRISQLQLAMSPPPPPLSFLSNACSISQNGSTETRSKENQLRKQLRAITLGLVVQDPSEFSVACKKLTKMSNMKRISTTQSMISSVTVLSSTKHVLYGIYVAVYINSTAMIRDQTCENLASGGMMNHGMFRFSS